jgi:hypothetical protein
MTLTGTGWRLPRRSLPEGAGSGLDPAAHHADLRRRVITIRKTRASRNRRTHPQPWRNLLKRLEYFHVSAWRSRSLGVIAPDAG